MIHHPSSATLRSERLLVRPLCLQDAESVFFNWASDPEVTRFLRWNPHDDIGVTKAWLLECLQAYRRNDYYQWGIERLDTKELIGTIGASPLSSDPVRYEVGYCIAKPHWNRGYTTEALRCVMNYLIHTVGIRSFFCMHAHENPASGAVMRKAGFRYQKDGIYASFDGQRIFPCAMYTIDL